MKKFQFIFALIFVIQMNSCTSDPVSSTNLFIIDNQSSINLFYNRGTGLDEMTIEIPRFTQTEIEEAAFDGDSAIRIEAEDFFTQSDEDIYLLKDVNGNLMEALQLNTIGVLNWETDMVNDVTYNHILQVTDELLN